MSSKTKNRKFKYKGKGNSYIPNQAWRKDERHSISRGKKKAKSPPINFENQGVSDLSQLTNLEMEDVLQNIEFRLLKMPRKHIYTSLQTILIAVNPYERLPNYGQDVINEFHDASKQGRIPENRPHPYGVAARSYMRMIQRKCNQSVIVCGESGSGKSETTKLIMRYLAMTAESSSMESSIIEQQIIATSPLLEAYGAAKTILNNNSSRFGKFTKILYDVPEKAKTGSILGSYLETYLLEKARVVFQAANERNYHIPHFLFQGLPKEEHDKFGIIDPRNWYYTSQGNCVEVPGINDRARFEELKECLALLRIDQDTQSELYCITCAVFNLGNIRAKKEGDGFASVDPAAQSVVETVAKLWGIKAKDLTDRLTMASMKVMKKKIMRKIEFEGRNGWNKGYVSNRDKIAKEVYENIFLYLCDRINAELYQSRDDDVNSILFIGILDVFGFQNFWINSLEQFCMNFCNEKLQQFFNFHIIRSEQEEYIKESVFWTPIAIPDNDAYMQLVENKDFGFFTTLDSACKAPQPSVEAFMQQLFKKNGKNTCIKRVTKPGGGNARGGPKGGKKKKKRNTARFEGFEITHFADLVTYDVSLFIDKNMEAMHPDTRLMLKKSTTVLAAEIGRTGAKGKKRKSVTAVFWSGIKILMKNLKATEPYFIVCVNPNNQKSKSIWSKHVVEHQLRSSGLVEALKVMKLGYPTRVPYSTLYDRYHQNITNPLIKNMGPEAFSTALLVAFDVHEDDYEAGLTKIFFKPRKAEVLDTIMSRANQPLSIAQNRKITDWVVSKRIKQLMGICKAFLKYKHMVDATRADVGIVKALEATIKQMKGNNDKLVEHKDTIITYFVQHKIDLINFEFTEDEFITELKQYCNDEQLHDALKAFYKQIHDDIKSLEAQNMKAYEEDSKDDAKENDIDMKLRVSWEDKIVSECIEHIQSVRILPPSIDIEDTALFKQHSRLQMEQTLLHQHEKEVEGSCESIQKQVNHKQDPMMLDDNPFKIEHKHEEEINLLQDVDNQSMNKDNEAPSKPTHKYEACRVRFEEELNAKTSGLQKTKSMLNAMENNKKKKCTCGSLKKVTKSMAFTAQVASRALSLVDIVSDCYLLYTASRIPELWFLTLTLVLSISASYIISYSSGVQLYLFRNTFDSLKGFKKLLMTFFILPTGIFYFVFLDLADIYLRLFRWMYFVLCCKSIQEMQQYEQILAAQLGMDRMNWEGFKAQRSIGQLMFESIPQFIVQTIVFKYLDLDKIIKGSDSDIASSNTISSTQLLISIFSAFVNIIGTVLRLKIDSICCKTDLISYALNCVKARVDWIPQLEHILDAIKNKTSTSIDFKMSYRIPCIPHTRNVEYDFSVTTVNRLISELRAIDISDYFVSELEDVQLLQIHFRDSLRLLPLQNIIELLAICQEKCVKVLSVENKGKKSKKKKYDWFSAIEISKAQGRDVQLLEYSRDDEGLPYIMKLMKLTDIEERRSIFRDLIEHDFDLNIHDLVTNESIVFTLIRSYDYKNLKYLFEHYSSNKGVLLRVNYHNKDGISPLGVALKLYEHEVYIRNQKDSQKHHQIPYLWEILFQHGATLEFSCKTNPDISPLMFALKTLNNKKLARDLMQHEAPIYASESTSLNPLFVHYQLEDEDYWKEEKAIQVEPSMKEIQDTEMNEQEEKYQIQPLQPEMNADSAVDDSWIALLCDVVKHFGNSLKSIGDSNDDNPLHFFIKHSNIKDAKNKQLQELKLKRLKHLIFVCKEWKKERNNDNEYPYDLILKQEDQYLFFALADFDEYFIPNIMSRKQSIHTLIAWITHMMKRVTAKFPKGLRRRDRRVNVDRDVQCLQKMFQKQYVGTNDIKWPNKHTVISSVDDASFDLMDICLDSSLIEVVLYLRKYWKFSLNEQQEKKLNDIRQLRANRKLQDEQARFVLILQKRDIDPLFDYLDSRSYVKHTLLSNKEFVLQIIEWIMDITQNISNKYPNGITDDIRVIGDVDIQTLDRMFNAKYFGKNIRWPLSSEEPEIELMNMCLEQKLYKVTLYLNKYWNINMSEEQKETLHAIKPETPKNNEDEKEIETETYVGDKEEKDAETDIKTQHESDEPQAKEGAKKITEKAVDFKMDTDSDFSSSDSYDDTDDDEQEEKRLEKQRFQRIKSRRFGTPPPIYNVENSLFDEADDKAIITVSNHQNMDKYNRAKQVASSLSLFASSSSSGTAAKIDKARSAKKGESHKIEILYSFLVESLSVADLITDILVVKQLIEAKQVWWISFMFLFMVSPYLVSHSTMCSLLSVRRSHYLPKQTRCPPLGLFTLNMLSLILLTPFAIVWFSLVDIIFMVYLVTSSLIFALSAGYCDISDVMDDILFQRVLGMTKMEVIGYRRLRTLSQLLFETFPQILLQIRILLAIRYEEQQAYNITTEELNLSIIIAFIHVVLEVAIIYLDARASKMSLSHYAVACLAARLHWIPFLTQIADKSRNTETTFDFEVIQYKVWFFCNNTYRIKYEFTPSSFKKLGERIMKLPVVASLNAPSNRILANIWTEYHVANTMPAIKLGKTCCRSLNLDLFPLFFRSAEKRVMIDTANMDWSRIIFQFKRSVYYAPDNIFLNVLLSEFLNFVEVELITQLALEMKLNDVHIKCEILQQLSVSSDILRILKKYYDKGVYFGLNSKVMQALYKIIDDNKWSIIYDTDTSYIYIIILMLFYTQRTIYKHQDARGSIKFTDDSNRRQLLQKISESILPKSIIVQCHSYAADEDDHNDYDADDDQIIVPFEIVECFKHFQPQMETFLIQCTSALKSEYNYMYIENKELFKYCHTVCNTQIFEFLTLITNASWRVIQQFPLHLLFAQLFCQLDPIIVGLEMVHGFAHYLLSSSLYRESKTVSLTLKYDDHSEILDIQHTIDTVYEEEEKQSASEKAGEIEMKTMVENEILLSKTQTSSDVIGVSRIEVSFEGFECKNMGEDVPNMGTIQLFTMLPIKTKQNNANHDWMFNKIVLAEISFERISTTNTFVIELYENEALGALRLMYTNKDRAALTPLKLSIKPMHEAIHVAYTRIHVQITYLLSRFKDVTLLKFENLGEKVYELQCVQLAKFVNKYKNELEEDRVVNRSQNTLHLLCDLADPNVEIFEMILKSKGNEMVNKVRFDGKTPLKVLQDNMRMDVFKKSEMLQRLLSHHSIQTVTKQKNVVIVGCKNSGKHTLLKQLKIHYKQNKFQRKLSYKLIIVKYIITIMKTLIKHCGDAKIAQLNNKDAIAICSIKTNTIRSIQDLPIEYDALFSSVQRLWNQRSIKRVYSDIGFMLKLLQSVQYFLDFRLKMIHDKSYIPSELDIVMLPDENNDDDKDPLQSTTCTVNDAANNELQIRWIVHKANKILKLSPIYNNKRNQNKEKKEAESEFEDSKEKEEKEEILSSTTDIDTIIFIVSLTSFMEMNVLHTTDNNFLHALKMYKSYCLDPKFNATKFVVILNKTDLFQRRLKNKNMILQKWNESEIKATFDEWIDLIKGMFTAQFPSRSFFFYHESIASDPKSLSIMKELENIVLSSKTIIGLPVKYHRIYIFLQQIDLESYYQQFVENGYTEITQMDSISSEQLENDVKMLRLDDRIKFIVAQRSRLNEIKSVKHQIKLLSTSH